MDKLGTYHVTLSDADVSRPAPSFQRYALRYEGGGTRRYVLTLTAGELDRLAVAVPLDATDDGDLAGFARPTRRAHVRALAAAADDLLGSVLVELPPDVEERSQGYVRKGEPARPVTLTVPATAQLVLLDGHHRVQALVLAGRFDTPLPVVAVRAQTAASRRDLHLRANLARPPRAAELVDLVPDATTPLPPALQARQTAAALLGRLARLPESPFHGRIRLASTANSLGAVSRAAVERALRRSLDVPSGSLFALRNLATDNDDLGAMTVVVVAFWRAVAEAFPDAWATPPAQSQITSPPALAALFRLMDASMSALPPSSPDLPRHAAWAVEAVRPLCRWTGGRWEALGGVAWDALGSDPDHADVLGNAFADAYRRSLRPRP